MASYGILVGRYNVLLKFHLIYIIFQASDQGSPPHNTTAVVSIVLADINDNTPIFRQNNYSCNASENAMNEQVNGDVVPVKSSQCIYTDIILKPLHIKSDILKYRKFTLKSKLFRKCLL